MFCEKNRAFFFCALKISYAPFVVKVKTNGSKEVFTLPTQNSTQTYEMLKTYLNETADSFEKLDEEPGFLYRKTDGRTSLVFCARVDKELGFLL